MQLDGAEKYFDIRYENGKVYIVNQKLDGAAFLAKNWAGLERLTLDGRQLRRVAGDPERYCVYGEERPEQQPQPTI